MKNFFEENSEFVDEEYGLNSYLNRLNKRYNALIDFNKNIIQGKRILDIASYDGRWTYAALKVDAKNVIGIELLPSSVKQANKNMSRHPDLEGKYQFIVGNVETEIMKFEEGSFDTIFCFGYFYHTVNQMKLMQEFSRLNPDNIIFDTSVSKLEKPVILLRKTQIKNPNALRGKITPKLNDTIIEGWPSRSALEMMLTQIGYDYEYYNWHNQGIIEWEKLGDYKSGLRITLRAKRKSQNLKPKTEKLEASR